MYKVINSQQKGHQMIRYQDQDRVQVEEYRIILTILYKIDLKIEYSVTN
jgi:hypothetical protein